MFAPEAPRTATGQLRNPWVETAYVALVTAIVQAHAIRVQAQMQWLGYTWQKPVMDMFVPELVRAHNEALMDGMDLPTFSDATPEDIATEEKPNILADLNAALDKIKRQYGQPSRSWREEQ